MQNNSFKTESLTPDQKEIETILSTKKTSLKSSDLAYLEISERNGKRVIRSKVSKVLLYIEVKPGQWEYPMYWDPDESILARNPRMSRESLEEVWDALGW